MWHGQPASARLRVPPLGTLWLRYRPGADERRQLRNSSSRKRHGDADDRAPAQHHEPLLVEGVELAQVAVEPLDADQRVERVHEGVRDRAEHAEVGSGSRTGRGTARTPATPARRHAARPTRRPRPRCARRRRSGAVLRADRQVEREVLLAGPQVAVCGGERAVRGSGRSPTTASGSGRRRAGRGSSRTRGCPPCRRCAAAPRSSSTCSGRRSPSRAISTVTPALHVRWTAWRRLRYRRPRSVNSERCSTTSRPMGRLRSPYRAHIGRARSPAPSTA